MSRGTKLDRIFGDHLSMGTELVGDRLSRGTNHLGTNCGGPNVRGPYAFRTKCVTAGITGLTYDSAHAIHRSNGSE